MRKPHSTHQPLQTENGLALIVAMMAMMLISALGAALILITSSETQIAANYRNNAEALYAAEAIAERAINELGSISSWELLLNGLVRSAFTDGPRDGMRRLPGGVAVDLTQVQATATDNPAWQLFAYGPLDSMFTAGPVGSPFYVLAMIAPGPSERDGEPSSSIALRAESFGPQGTHKVLELTVGRWFAPQDRRETHDEQGDRREQDESAGTRRGVRVLSWREFR